VHHQPVGVPLDPHDGLDAGGAGQALRQPPRPAVVAFEGFAHLGQARGPDTADESRLERDQPLQQCLGVELEREEDGSPAGGNSVARDLQSHGRLALALRPGKQVERPGPKASPKDVVDQWEPGRPDPH
jgi:hypothetical protein